MRLSKEDAKNTENYTFNGDEVPVDEVKEGATVLVRSLSLGERERFNQQTPDKPGDWTLDHTALLFSVAVHEPKFTKEEALEFLSEWPAPALDRIVAKFNELVADKEVQRNAVGEFPDRSEGE